MTSLWDQGFSGLRGRRQDAAARDQVGVVDTPGRPTMEAAGTRDCGTAAEPRWPDRPALHRSHDAHSHGGGPQAAEVGDTVATRGATGPPADRQPRPDRRHNLIEIKRMRYEPPRPTGATPWRNENASNGSPRSLQSAMSRLRLRNPPDYRSTVDWQFTTTDRASCNASRNPTAEHAYTLVEWPVGERSGDLGRGPSAGAVFPRHR